MKPNRLAGHELYFEGAAYNAQGRIGSFTTAGTGFAKCSCGAKSPILESGAKRKAWHRAHKDEIRKAA